MVRRPSHTLAVLQAAFSTVLVSCAPPPPTVASSDPLPPPAPTTPVASAAPAAPEPPVDAPTTPVTDPPASPPSAKSAAGFVEGASNVRNPGQLCLGVIVPALRPGKPVDSLEMRVKRRRGKEMEIVVTGRAGSPCGTAKDRDACQRAYEAAVPTKAGEVLVFTRGEEVGLVEPANVAAFLAPIDSVEEAAAVLVYAPPDDKSDATCEPSTFTATKTGFTSKQERWGGCDHDVITYTVAKDGKTRRAGTQHIQGRRPCQMPVPGRRTEGLVADAAPGSNAAPSIGGYLAEACTLEAASVTSFRRLVHELGALGAPADLRRRARSSARDEARHARTMRRLARRAGVEPSAPRITPVARRGALAIAIENAVEGCVHETWAALVARFQADHAVDGEVRAAMTVIADDEARHAALAWDVRAWLDARLSDEEKAVVRIAYERALATLVDASAGELSAGDREALGLPSAETARALASGWARLVPVELPA